jgi:subtilase family serine protease
MALWNDVWEQAAAQGMSVFVASGDAGAAGCASAGPVYNNVGNIAAVNGVASSPYVTAVGGTEFDETVNGATSSSFWSATNGANLASAIG